jgi:hypothetical protein
MRCDVVYKRKGGCDAHMKEFHDVDRQPTIGLATSITRLTITTPSRTAISPHNVNPAASSELTSDDYELLSVTRLGWS